MAEERRSSLSYNMGGSFETGQISQERSQQELADIHVQFDELKRENSMIKKVLGAHEKELLEVMRQNGEHEALSRTLLSILNYVSSVELVTLILKHARYVGVDLDLALVALVRLYGDVANKTMPHIITVIRGNVLSVDSAESSDWFGKVPDFKT